MSKRTLILPVLAAAAIAAGCGGGGYGEQTATEPAAARSADTATKAAATIVDMTGSTFAPDAVDVKVGDTVLFVNKDEIAHTATAEGTFDSKTMDAGATFDFVAGMTGTLNVS